MPIRIVCPTCDNALSVPDAAAGKVMACPDCQAKLRVPEPPPQGMRMADPDDRPPVRQSPRDDHYDDPPRRRRRADRDDEFYEDRPARRGRFRCPYCGSGEIPSIRKRISTSGWVVFCVLLLVCLPLCFLGLLITEEYKVCYDCGITVGG